MRLDLVRGASLSVAPSSQACKRTYRFAISQTNSLFQLATVNKQKRGKKSIYRHESIIFVRTVKDARGWHRVNGTSYWILWSRNERIHTKTYQKSTQKERTTNYLVIIIPGARERRVIYRETSSREFADFFAKKRERRRWSGHAIVCKASPLRVCRFALHVALLARYLWHSHDKSAARSQLKIAINRDNNIIRGAKHGDRYRTFVSRGGSVPAARARPSTAVLVSIPMHHDKSSELLFRTVSRCPPLHSPATSRVAEPCVETRSRSRLGERVKPSEGTRVFSHTATTA